MPAAQISKNDPDFQNGPELQTTISSLSFFFVNEVIIHRKQQVNH